MYPKQIISHNSAIKNISIYRAAAHKLSMIYNLSWYTINWIHYCYNDIVSHNNVITDTYICIAPANSLSMIYTFDENNNLDLIIIPLISHNNLIHNTSIYEANWWIIDEDEIFLHPMQSKPHLYIEQQLIMNSAVF